MTLDILMWTDFILGKTLLQAQHLNRSHLNDSLIKPGPNEHQIYKFITILVPINNEP